MPRAVAGKVAQGGVIDELDGWTGGNEGGPELVVPLAPSPGCQNADTCPAQGLGHWLRYVDKSGERTTKHEDDGSFWNRSCPAPGCTVRVYA